MKYCFPVFILLSLCFFSQAQDNQGQRDFQLWYDYYHYHRLPVKNLEFYSDNGLRHNAGGGFQWLRLHIRPSLHWRPRQIIGVHGGFGFFYTFLKQDHNEFEFRPWQGAKLHWPNFWRLKWTLFVRLEERFAWAGDFAFKFKMRFKLGTNFPLNNKSIINKTFYIPLAFELFVNIGKAQEQFADRNRFETGLGYRINPQFTVRLLYTLQAFKDESFDFDNNDIDHVIRFTCIHRLDSQVFKRKGKKE